MTESELKGELMRTFEAQDPKGFTFRIENSVHSGIPDIIDSCQKVSTWLEVKYLNPRLKCTGLQKWTARTLAQQACCWFVMYEQDQTRSDIRRTMIFHPRKSVNWKGTAPPSYLTADCWTAGFNHQFVVDFVRKRQFHDYHRS